jgi:xylan 1,4-beta-xylosidase
MMNRRNFLQANLALAATTLPGSLRSATTAEHLDVRINARSVTGALPHVWEECAGSDRAVITLREAWREDLDRWHKEAGLKRVRFHGIFNDELGVYAPSILTRGKAEINFQNVFQVYDGLKNRGVSPYVELSFMPKKLASGPQTFAGYNGNITPPTSSDEWAAFVSVFVKSLVNRYGLKEVRTWPFEVWNEPNLPFFWTGSQQQYFDMYKATAVALKQIDPGIMVGGPATSATAWIGDFVTYCADNHAPVDFFSTHIYAGDKQDHVFGPGVHMSQNDVIPAAMARVRQKIDASAFAGKPLWLSEWSSDSPAMIAHVIAHCLPSVQGMSQWTLSGVYEELGVPNYVLKEGDMGWSTLVRGIARPSFNTYKLLHALGDHRLEAQGPALASRRRDGSLAILVWNLAEVPQAAGIPGATSTRTVIGQPRTLDIRIAGVRPGQKAQIRYVDQERGSPMPAWRQMGSPQYPTQTQLGQLRKASEIPSSSQARMGPDGSLKIELPSEGVALIEI